MQAVQHEIEQRRVAQVEASRTKKYRPKRKPWSRQRKFLVFAAMLIGIGLSLLNTINNPPETDTVASGQPTPRDVALPGSQVAPDVSTTWPVHDVQQIVTTTLPQRTLSRVGVAVQSRQFRFVMPEEPVVETATEMELGVEVTWTSWTADDPEYYVQVNSTCVPGSIDQVSLDEAIGEYLDEVLEIGSGTLLVNESVSNSTGLIGRRTVVGIDRQRLFIEIYGGSGCLVTVASYSSSQEVSAEHTSVITSFLWSQ